ncbi:hypothetical protein [Mesorhizobium sp. M0006]|uniref:hypothetical protein n=1 Tax=Mesorhizobium sp. M0006 TaxID=2956838 RepID=UPI00333DC8AB
MAEGEFSGLHLALVGDGGCAKAGLAGVAVGTNSCYVEARNLGVAYARDHSYALTVDGGIAHISGYYGFAHATNGVAYCVHGDRAQAHNRGSAIAGSGVALADDYGLASCRLGGFVQTGKGGVAIAWNHPDDDTNDGVNPSLGTLTGSAGAVLIAFKADPVTGGRQPVIGVVGDFSTEPVVQLGLRAGAFYQISRETGAFVEVIAELPAPPQGAMDAARRCGAANVD